MSEEAKIDAKRVQAITNMGQAYDDVDPLAVSYTHLLWRWPSVSVGTSPSSQPSFLTTSVFAILPVTTR